ncbi:MAG: lipoyl synthase [Nanobdellota archaeon]
MNNKLPLWIKVGKYNKHEYLKTKTLIEKNCLNTVCIEANCPNKYECFSKKTATFMILGNTCTRNCLYCNVKRGKPEKPDENEPERIAEAVKKLGLRYAVITCVTRDDLKDGGGEQFVKTVNAIKNIDAECKIELLISDLKGNWKALEKIISAGPDVLNHNIEVPRVFFPRLRPQGDYEISLQLLEKVKKLNFQTLTKSGFMLGFGEKKSQILNTIKDLKNAGCKIITIGQYLQPNKDCVKVKKYYAPEEFEEFKAYGESLGMKVVSGPMVRSSYKASEVYN